VTALAERQLDLERDPRDLARRRVLEQVDGDEVRPRAHDQQAVDHAAGPGALGQPEVDVDR